MDDEINARRVWPLPDQEPVVFDKPRSCYASWPWLTDDFMREAENG
jgi:hypothetical protein